jgi:hypothetical protein
VNLHGLPSQSIRAFWFNPCQNAAQLIGTFERTEKREFSPPTRGRNNDWVLVIDDASENLPKLGFSYQHITPKVVE